MRFKYIGPYLNKLTNMEGHGLDLFLSDDPQDTEYLHTFPDGEFRIRFRQAFTRLEWSFIHRSNKYRKYGFCLYGNSLSLSEGYLCGKLNNSLEERMRTARIFADLVGFDVERTFNDHAKKLSLIWQIKNWLKQVFKFKKEEAE